MIQRRAENRLFENQANRLKKLKFEILLSRFVGSLEKTIARNKRSALGLIRIILAVPNCGNSRLSKIKRLKGKISGEARKLETKLSKSVSGKERSGFGKGRFEFRASRPRQTINQYASFLVNKENGSLIIDHENRMLEISIRQTEKFIYKFMRDVSLEMSAVGQREFQDNSEKEANIGIKNREK